MGPTSAIVDKLVTVLCLGLLGGNRACRTPSGVRWGDSWNLVWRDDFSNGYASLDENWDFELADAWQYGFNQFGNFEQQFYSRDSVTVEGNVLKITARYNTDPAVVEGLCWEECYGRCLGAGKVPGTPDFDGCMDGCGNTGRRCKNLGKRGITSGRIYTKKAVIPPPSNKSPVVRLEAKIRLPEPGLGVWPAFWALPPKNTTRDPPGHGIYGPWPNSGEIDVVETANQLNFINGSLHYGTERNPIQKSVEKSDFSGMDGKFHVFGVEWRKTSFKWYVDGRYYGSSKSPGRPFDTAFQPILNLAIGGNFTEYHAGRIITVEDTQKMLRGRPRTMEVDWVQVWSKV
jgi:beta-glucanase (GH16 family)